MALETYTQWRSGNSDDEEEREAEGDEGGKVTIITKPKMKPKMKKNSRLSTTSQARVTFVLVLSALVCVAVGVGIGWAWAASCPQYPVHHMVPTPTTGYNHSHLLLANLQPMVIRKYLRRLSSKPLSLLEAYLEGVWREQGLDTTTTTFTIHASKVDPRQPSTIKVYFNDESSILFNLTPKDVEIPPFQAYSPAGEVTGQLVHGSYGRLDDLKGLQTHDVNLQDSILLLRHGKINPGVKVRNAAQVGAAAVLLYPDPDDTQGSKIEDKPYPGGTKLPGDGVLWGTLLTTPGDPSTPFLPSLPQVYRLDKEAQDLPPIPTQSISLDTAKYLLARLSGPETPDRWVSGLNANNTIGGSRKEEEKIANVTVSIKNIIESREVKNIHATLPGSDESRVIMVGSHYGSLQGRGKANVGLAALLALSEALSKSYLPRGTQRKIVFSAWAAGEEGMIGSTEFTQLHHSWVEGSILAYLGMDELVRGTGALKITSSSALREAVREASKQVLWPKENYRGRMNVRAGWRLSDSPGRTDVYFHNVGSIREANTFTLQCGVPSVTFANVGADWKASYPLQHSQYDTPEAFTRFLDPKLEWTHMITSLVGATMMVLSESEIPPLLMSDLSGDLYNGWMTFLDQHLTLLDHSGYNFTGIIAAIEQEIIVLEDTLTVLDGWYKSRSFYTRPYPHHYPGAHHSREVEQRLWWMANLEKGLLGPRSVSRSFATHLILGPDPKNPDAPLHFPFVVASISHALSSKGSWENVHKELSYILAALTSYRQLFPGDLPAESPYNL